MNKKDELAEFYGFIFMFLLAVTAAGIIKWTIEEEYNHIFSVGSTLLGLFIGLLNLDYHRN